MEKKHDHPIADNFINPSPPENPDHIAVRLFVRISFGAVISGFHGTFDTAFGLDIPKDKDLRYGKVSELMDRVMKALDRLYISNAEISACDPDDENEECTLLMRLYTLCAGSKVNIVTWPGSNLSSSFQVPLRRKDVREVITKRIEAYEEELRGISGS